MKLLGYSFETHTPDRWIVKRPGQRAEQEDVRSLLNLYSSCTMKRQGQRTEQEDARLHIDFVLLLN